MAIYSILMLFVIATLVFNRKGSNTVTPNDESTILTDITVQKEYVYVRPEEISTSENTEEQKFWIKEYNGLVGIFNADGSLYRTIDTRVKTLPEADQGLLEEGFEVIGKSQLNSIIEDYSE
jgi:hypothetical protein